MNNKVKNAVTSKTSIWGTVGVIVTGLLGYGGHQTFYEPAKDKLLVGLNNVEHNQETNNEILKEHTKWLIANIMINHPKIKLDSIYKEADFFIYWKSKH